MGNRMEGEKKKSADLMTAEERAAARRVAMETIEPIITKHLGVRAHRQSSSRLLEPAKPDPEPEPHSSEEEMYFAPSPKEQNKSRNEKGPHQESFDF